MTLWLLILQCALYALVAIFAFVTLFNDTPFLKPISFLIIVINLVLSCCLAWCTLTVVLFITSLLYLLFMIVSVDDNEPECFRCYILLTFVILVFILYGAWGNPTKPGSVSKNVETTTELCSASTTGTNNTTIFGANFLLFGSVSGSTKLEYYYSYYYQNEKGAVLLASVPTKKTELYPILDNERPYIKTIKTYMNNVSWLTSFPAEGETEVDCRYELYAPATSFPTEFNFKLN